MSHFISPKLSDRQLQIIRGTVLGGSSLIRPKGGKSCYLSMRDKNAKWLEYKAAELKELASLTPFTVEKTYRWHSLCYPILNGFEAVFYKRGRRFLTVDNISPIADVAFGVWFGDCGRWVGDLIVLNTNVWGRKGSEEIRKYFSCLDYQSEVFCERGRFRVKLDHKASMAFWSIAEPTLPHWFIDSIRVRLRGEA